MILLAVCTVKGYSLFTLYALYILVLKNMHEFCHLEQINKQTHLTPIEIASEFITSTWFSSISLTKGLCCWLQEILLHRKFYSRGHLQGREKCALCKNEIELKFQIGWREEETGVSRERWRHERVERIEAGCGWRNTLREQAKITPHLGASSTSCPSSWEISASLSGGHSNSASYRTTVSQLLQHNV